MPVVLAAAAMVAVLLEPIRHLPTEPLEVITAEQLAVALAGLVLSALRELAAAAAAAGPAPTQAWLDLLNSQAEMAVLALNSRLFLVLAAAAVAVERRVMADRQMPVRTVALAVYMGVVAVVAAASAAVAALVAMVRRA
jgi:hypothetical protein